MNYKVFTISGLLCLQSLVLGCALSDGDKDFFEARKVAGFNDRKCTGLNLTKRRIDSNEELLHLMSCISDKPELDPLPSFVQSLEKRVRPSRGSLSTGRDEGNLLTDLRNIANSVLSYPRLHHLTPFLIKAQKHNEFKKLDGFMAQIRDIGGDAKQPLTVSQLIPLRVPMLQRQRDISSLLQNVAIPSTQDPSRLMYHVVPALAELFNYEGTAHHGQVYDFVGNFFENANSNEDSSTFIRQLSDPDLQDKVLVLLKQIDNVLRSSFFSDPRTLAALNNLANEGTIARLERGICLGNDPELGDQSSFEETKDFFETLITTYGDFETSAGNGIPSGWQQILNIFHVSNHPCKGLGDFIAAPMFSGSNTENLSGALLQTIARSKTIVSVDVMRKDFQTSITYCGLDERVMDDFIIIETLFKDDPVFYRTLQQWLQAFDPDPSIDNMGQLIDGLNLLSLAHYHKMIVPLGDVILAALDVAEHLSQGDNSQEQKAYNRSQCDNISETAHMLNGMIGFATQRMHPYYSGQMRTEHLQQPVNTNAYMGYAGGAPFINLVNSARAYLNLPDSMHRQVFSSLAEPDASNRLASNAKADLGRNFNSALNMVEDFDSQGELLRFFGYLISDQRQAVSLMDLGAALLRDPEPLTILSKGTSTPTNKGSGSMGLFLFMDAIANSRPIGN